MSTLSVTNINTANGTTDLTVVTGNTSNPGMVLSSSNGVLLVGNSSFTGGRTIYASGGGTSTIARIENFSSGTGANVISNTGTGLYVQSSTGTIAQFVNATATIASVNSSGIFSNGISSNASISSAVNNQKVTFTPLAGGANVYFIQQNDDNFVFYSTNTVNQPRAVWSVFGNSISSNVSFSVPVQIGANLTVTTNTLTLGSSTNAASGFTILPNGFKMNWGTAVTNSIGQNVVTFSSAFTTNSYGVSLTILSASANAGLANAKMAFVSTVNGSAMTITTANNNQAVNAGATAVYYMAIGPA